MREALKKVRPDGFDDLVALNALYRPGAMDQIPTYARGKRNPELDQLPRRAPAPDPRVLHGRDPLPGAGDADRQARSPASRGRRPTTCARRSARRTARRWRSSSRSSSPARARAAPREDVIDFLWSTNEKSADYSFNRSHAACYALIAYRTAWLKANYPAEYMAALISSVMSTKDRVPFFVARCEEMGIEILPPDVNLSDHEFTVIERNIRFGLDAVKGVGYQAVEAIKRAREEGGAVQLAVGLLRARRRPRGEQEGDRGADQVRRVRLDRRDPARHARGARAGAGRGAEGAAGRDDRPGRRSSTSATSARRPPPAPPARPPIPTIEFEQRELLAAEKEAIGLFISAHPLKEVREALALAVDCPLSRGAASGPTRTRSRSAGSSPQARKIRTRAGSDMMFATLDDLEGQVELIVFGASLEKLEGALAVDAIVTVRGPRRPEGGRAHDRGRAGGRALSPRRRGGRARAQAARARARAAAGRCTSASARPRAPPTLLEDLRHVLGTFPGESEVVIELSDARRLRLGDAFRVEPSASLRAELEQLLGGSPCGSPRRRPAPLSRHAARPGGSRRRGAAAPGRARPDHRGATSSAVGPGAVGAGRLQHAGQAAEARLVDEGARARRGRARRRRCSRGGRGWSRAASASR